ncbi:membrane protein [Streptomyces fumigatiscleroticus]|nr:membrane protein [Streptomyces fumigatiscleroticus]
MSTQTATPVRPAADERSSLLRLYLGRGVLAVAWALAFAGAHEDIDAVAVTLLVVYPLIDAVSSLIDYRATPDGTERGVTAFNGVLSTLAAVAVGIAGAGGEGAVLHAFGAWAVVSGAAQVIVGLRRRGPELGKQWPTLISGGLSFLVGIFYNIQAAGDNPSLDVLSVYATGGGVWFILQALLLGWKSRQLRARTV